MRLRCPLWPKTSPFFIVNTPKRRFNLMLSFVSLLSLISLTIDLFIYFHV
jgi:hypothetical protein